MDFDVGKVAALAYLELTPAEKQSFESQFKSILNYVDKLQTVPMKPEEAQAMGAYHVTTAFYELLGLDSSESLRQEDQSPEVQNLNLVNEEALRNAPASSGIPGELLYEVPSIIERET